MAELRIEDFLALERRVWAALMAGDAEADAALLAEDFIGLYPTGFADRAEHAGQLDDGPTVESYEISEERVVQISESAVMLLYRADWTRTGSESPEAMYVSSLWCSRDGEWLNTFSQDCPAE